MKQSALLCGFKRDFGSCSGIVGRLTENAEDAHVQAQNR